MPKNVETLCVSFPTGLKERAMSAAREDGRSLSNFVSRAVEQALAASAKDETI